MPGSAARRFVAALFSPLPVVGALAVAVNAALVAPGIPGSVVRAAGITALVLSAALAAIAVHDAAHWITARALGFRTIEATIGVFTFAPSRRGLLVRAVRTWSGLRAALIVEPRGERRMNARWALVAASGPAASLLLGILLLDAAPAIAIASLVRFTLAALPMGVRGVPNDGAQVLVLLAGGAAADRLTALTRIAAAQRAGVRPRAWPEVWITEATALHDGTAAEALACVASFRRALDGCAHYRAAALLDRALALRAMLPRAAACALLADAAYFEARIHDDPDRARLWLDEAAARRPACPVAERRASAAVLIAAGDLAGGAVAAREALEQLDRVEREERRSMPMEADWLHEMLARAECASVFPAEFLAAS
jgi:hypothetical protein